MTKPTKIPINFALEALNSTNRGYANPQDDVTAGELERDAVNDNYLVPVSKLRKHFANKTSFESFKANLSVPDNYWSECQSESSKKYAKRFMRAGSARKRGRPPTKKRHRIVTKIGNYSDSDVSDADSDTSVISIIPSDEDDDNDPNFPIPVCKGIRRVCRVYDKSHRYLPYKKDSSDDKRYHLQVSYKKPKK